jgi:hypothetical protein
VVMSGVRCHDSTQNSTNVEVVLGVDTHLDFHVAVALDDLGRYLGELRVPTTTKGYTRLVCWAEGFGVLRYAGVEGTSSYGAGLVRYLTSAGITVAEVERPKRRHLRRNGKSDPLDAEAAARAVLAGETAGTPKSTDGHVEMIRALRTPAPSAGGRCRPGVARPASCRHRPRGDAVDRGRGQSREVEERGFLRQPLWRLARRSLLRQGGQTSPKPYVGNRDANRALHMICMVRMGMDRRTREYVGRRTAEGKSKLEILRCLKRYVAREVYRVLVVSSKASPWTTGYPGASSKRISVMA